jgi:cell division protein FtsI (penicillin-binding protein 3)
MAREQVYSEESLRTRLIITLSVGAAMAFLVLGRSAYIQLFKNDRLEAIAKRQYQTKSLIKPNRGSILDRNGEPLAVSVEAYSLAANPTKIRQRWTIARLLAKSIHSSYIRLMNKLSEPKEFVWIKRHLSEAELKSFKKLGVVDTDGDLADGLWLVKESNRVYPRHCLAAHILGNVNVDSEGLEGVELWQEEKLRGRVASVSAIKDALGRPTLIDAQAANQLQDGESVTLTLDSVLQYEVEQELSNAIRRTGAHAGVVIVMDAVTGEILALANEPAFDPNQKGVPPERRRNRALTDGFEPGSILKPILLAGALSHGWRLSDEVWGEKGSFIIQKHKISEAEAHEKYEWISLKKIIQVSSNIGAAKLALKLGADRYLKTLISFGFGAKTGIGFPGEISGRIPPKKEMQPLTLANIGFGQGLLVTPLQVARAYAAILNGGWLVEPSLIKTKPSEFKTKSEIELTFGALRQIMSRRIGAQVIEALESVTHEGGTGIKAGLVGYRVAGKTGTAQEIDSVTHKYSHDKYTSSFVGFPVDTERKIVVLASINEPHGVYYASETAAPLFREVLGSVVRHYSIPASFPDKSVPEMQKNGVILSNFKEETLRVSDRMKLSQSAPGFGEGTRLPELPKTADEEGKWVMPSLVGLTQRESIQILHGHGFHLEMKGLGVVSTQRPLAGKKLGEKDTVRLFFSEP